MLPQQARGTRVLLARLYRANQQTQLVVRSEQHGAWERAAQQQERAFSSKKSGDDDSSFIPRMLKG